MTESELQCLKNSIDKTLEIQTIDGEHLFAKVLAVFCDQEYDEHELFYELISTNMPESYQPRENAGGCALDFDKIVSAKPVDLTGGCGQTLGART
jgi:hypothetical protein